MDKINGQFVKYRVARSDVIHNNISATATADLLTASSTYGARHLVLWKVETSSLVGSIAFTGRATAADSRRNCHYYTQGGNAATASAETISYTSADTTTAYYLQVEGSQDGACVATITSGNVTVTAIGLADPVFDSEQTGTNHAVDGTAALPTYSFALDTNTGFYRVGADEIGVAIGGALDMSFQANALNIASGSTINFDAAADTAADFLLDVNGNELLETTGVASAVNQLGIRNAATGNGPMIEVIGETNVPLNLLAKGTGAVIVNNGTDPVQIQMMGAASAGTNEITDLSGNEVLAFTPVASAVNEITISNAATGTAGPIIEATGETNIDIQIKAKGTGFITTTTSSGGMKIGNAAAHSTPGVHILSFKTGTEPVGAVTTSGGIHTNGTVMRKVIADGTVSNVET